MRLFAIFAIGLTLSACVSPEAVYQRSLAAPHSDVPEADFEQIADILSHHTHQSITTVKALQSDEVGVHVAFSGEERSRLGRRFCFGQARWHLAHSQRYKHRDRMI